MKPLYLDGNQVLRAKLEHSAIRVTSQQLADVWFPLQRISRVIIHGHLELSSTPLAACLSNNIPVVIAGAGGEYVGICFGTDYRQQTLQSHVLELHESRSQLYLLDDWFQAQQRRQILHLQKRFRLPRSQYEPAFIKARLNELICLDHQFYYWADCLKRLLPMLAAQQTVLLKHFGFDSEVLRRAPATRGLLQQFIELLEWELWALAANGQLPTGKRRNQLIHYFQQHSPVLERKTRAWVDSLWHRFYEIEHEQK